MADSVREGTAAPDRVERRARWAVTASFVITGMSGATWTARVPAIKQDLGLDDASLGVALLSIGAGSLVAMQMVGRLVDRFGSAAVMFPAGLLTSVGLILPGYAPSYPALLGALLLFGAGLGMLDVSMNAHAVLLEQRYRRPIMIAFHATYSVGSLLGALLGTLAVRAGLNAGAHFAFIGVALALLTVAARRWLLPARPAQATSHRPPGDRRALSLAICFLGALGFFSMVGEGSMADWSAVYLRDAVHTSMSFAPIGYAVFSTAMGLFRFLGDRLAARIGPVLLVRCSGLVAGAGLGMALLLGSPVAALTGFGLFGIGLACIVPQVFTAAGNRDPGRSGRDLALVSTLSYTGLLAGPAAIGLLAHAFGLPVALAVPAGLALLVAVSANAVRPRPALSTEELPVH